MGIDRRHPLFFALAAAYLLGSLVAAQGCRRGEEPDRISPAVRRQPGPSPAKSSQPPLRFAVASMISPAPTFSTYEDILAHVAARADRSFSFVQRRTYQEVNDLLLSGNIDLAFICSGAFASLPRDAELELLAVPVVGGESSYYSLVVVRSGDDLAGLADLEGKRFAFTDPLSNTGYFYPLTRLGEIGRTPKDFFSNTLFTGSHDGSIVAVHRKLVDAAAVDSLVFDQVVVSGSRYHGKLEVIEKSSGFPMPPFVAPKSVPAELRRTFRDALLRFHETPEGQQLLSRIGIDHFVAGDPAAYTVIRNSADRARAVVTQ